MFTAMMPTYLVLQHQPIYLWAIAKEALDSVVIWGLERQITLNFECNILEIQQFELFGDRLQLSREFTNLLSNAVYHSPDSGRIDIEIDYLDFNYLIQVVDRLRGTSLVDLSWIFNRFYRAR